MRLLLEMSFFFSSSFFMFVLVWFCDKMAGSQLGCVVASNETILNGVFETLLGEENSVE